MNSQKKPRNRSSNVILECYYNARIISYMVLRSNFGYGIKRIKKLEDIIDGYFDDYSSGKYESGFFINQMLSRGVDVRKFANEIPSRVKLKIVYGGKIPRDARRNDIENASLLLCTFFGITTYALNHDMKISANKIRDAYLPAMKFNFECLSEKNRMSIEDVVRVMIDECGYVDPRYIIEKETGQIER